jgi:hypothetical protein
LGPLALALVLAFGWFAVWLAVLLGGMLIVEQVAMPRVYRQVVVEPDGTLVVVERSFRNYQEVVYRNADGTLRSVQQEPTGLIGASLPGEGAWATSTGWSSRLSGFAIREPERVYWYGVYDGPPPARLYFVGFDPVTKARVGFLGRNGFSETLPPPEQHFELARVVDGLGYNPLGYEPVEAVAVWAAPAGGIAAPTDAARETSVFVATPDALHRIDLARRTTAVVLREPAIVSASRLVLAATSERPQLVRAVRTRDRILLLGDDSSVPRSYRLPKELHDERLTVYALADGQLLAQFSLLDTAAQRFVKFDAEGRVSRRHELPPSQSPGPAWLTSLLVPAPLFDTLANLALYPTSRHAVHPKLSYRDALERTLSGTWPGLVANCLIGVLAAVACVRQQRAFVLSGTPVWAIFVLLLGVPGLLGYLCHRSWPPRSACPACGQMAPRDRPACRDCGQAFPLPARSGMEIFA